MRAKRKAFVGIDVAFAKGKPLPVCVYAAGPDGGFDLLPLKCTFDKPPVGQGNAAALSPGLRRGFAARTSAWLRALETRENLSIHGIALDAPSDYCPPERTHRACEAAVARDGIAVWWSAHQDRAFAALLADSGFAVEVERVVPHARAKQATHVLFIGRPAPSRPSGSAAAPRRASPGAEARRR